MKTPKKKGKLLQKISGNGSPISTTATDIEEPRTSDIICQKICGVAIK